MTSYEIAKLAGVSRATVYRVLNHKPNVKDEVRLKVQAVIDEYGYRPNVAGKALVKQRRQGVIGVLLPKIESDFYMQVREGIDTAAAEYEGMGFEVGCLEMSGLTAEDELSAIAEMKKRRADGIVLVGVDDEKVKDALRNVPGPVVTLLSDIRGTERICFVGNELVKSGRTAGQLMAMLLRPSAKIGIIATGLGLQAHRDRIEGFRGYAAENGLEVFGIYENGDDDEKTYAAGKRILEERPDGIYMTTGLGTDGLERALRECNQQGKVRVILSDMGTSSVRMLVQGSADFIICQEPYREGYLALKLLLDYLVKGEMPAQKEYLTKIEIITSESI